MPSFHRVGPSTFLSYCFRDVAKAAAVARFLASIGCRVRMEDETTLIGRCLTDVLPQRVRDAELFVQLRTPVGQRSLWMGRELDYAARERDGLQPVIALLSESDEPPPAPDARVIDHSAGRLTDHARAALAEAADASVCALPLSLEDPFRFELRAVDRALAMAGAAQRRVIADSRALLMEWTEATLAVIAISDAPHRDRWLAQEKKRQETLSPWLKQVDREVSRLLHALRGAYERWACTFPGSAAKALEYYGLVRLGVGVLERAVQSPEVQIRYAKRFERLRTELPNDSEFRFEYLRWYTGERFPRSPAREVVAQAQALQACLGDGALKVFAQSAKRSLTSILRRRSSEP